MKMTPPDTIGSKRKAIAGILATIIVLGTLFTIGTGFLVYWNQTTLTAAQANSNRENAIQQASQEKLSISASLSGSTITLSVTNRGGVPTTILDAFVANTNGVMQSPGIMANPCPQATLNIGSTASCPLTGYNYPSGTTVYLSLITSRGNTFTLQYPTPSSIISTVSTTTMGTVSTTTLPYVGIGSNALVIDMVASPPVAFTCTNGCVLVNVTVYNYQKSGSMSSVALSPNPPTITLCTGNVPGCTATLTPCTLTGSTCTPAVPPNPPSSCSGPFNSNHTPDSGDSIPAYAGSGVAPDIYFLCYYDATTGVVGGFATFSGQATAMLGTAPIASALATSNAIKIGGSANVLNQGPFSANFFYFVYSACTNTNTPCTSNPAFTTTTQGGDIPNGPLPDGYLISGNTYYVAYYIQITNNFNTSLPILQYTFFQSDATLGDDSDFFIVGPPVTSGTLNSTFYNLYTNTYSPSPAYYPMYTSSSPTLSAYTGNAVPGSPYNCNPQSGGSLANCVDINPGKTVTLTLAACNYGSNSWDWYNSANGASNGAGQSGTTGCKYTGENRGTNPPDYSTPEATWLGIIIFFIYNGQVYAQQIPFAGDLICDSNC